MAAGKAEGKAEGEAEAVLKVLAARRLAVSEELCERVRRCTDLALLDRWLARAVTCRAAEELLSGD